MYSKYFDADITRVNHNTFDVTKQYAEPSCVVGRPTKYAVKTRRVMLDAYQLAEFNFVERQYALQTEVLL